jgi:hypothetical protein
MLDAHPVTNAIEETGLGIHAAYSIAMIDGPSQAVV